MGENPPHQNLLPPHGARMDSPVPRADHVWEHRGWMTTVLAARTGGRWDVAEDLWAEIVASILERPSLLVGVLQIRAWLYRLAIHKAADWIRNQQRDGVRFSAIGSELLANDLVTSAELPPFELLLSDERRSDLQQTLARLSAEDQEVLYLKYLHHWSYIQIGEQLNLTPYQVTSRLRMARQRLKLALLQSPLAEDYSLDYQLGIHGVSND
ncbi:MAG: sigma-70 family RNA polymerase sigma factor [Planctomycetaceae bacterium]|nr:sigma-70 family RNA polymerase sigma factor [Planctomycetaceae bacterium]